MWKTFLWDLKPWKDICQVSDDSSSTPVTAYRGNLMLKPCDVTRLNQPVTKTTQSIKHSENEESYTWEYIMPRKQIWRTSVVPLYCLAVKLTLWTESWIIKKNYSIWLSLWPQNKGVVDSVKPHMVHLLLQKPPSGETLSLISFSVHPFFNLSVPRINI